VTPISAMMISVPGVTFGGAMGRYEWYLVSDMGGIVDIPMLDDCIS